MDQKQIKSTGDRERNRRSQVSSSSSRHSSSRNRYSRSQKKIIKLLLISWGLAGVLVIVILIWIMTSIKVSSLNGELLLERATTREQAAKAKQLAIENEELGDKIEELEQERAQLVQSRIPRLHPLSFDVTIPINQRYFRNISFTLTGTSHERNYEYHVVMHNEGSGSIKPDVTLFLFDELGVQVGKTHLSEGDATSELDSPALEPGETRSYSNQVKLEHPSKPEYFLIDIR